MARPQKRYPQEFRDQAVELYLSVADYRTMRDVAQELGIHVNNLRRWLKAVEQDSAETPTSAAPAKGDCDHPRRQPRQLRGAAHPRRAASRPRRPLLEKARRPPHEGRRRAGLPRPQAPLPDPTTTKGSNERSWKNHLHVSTEPRQLQAVHACTSCTACTATPGWMGASGSPR